MPAEVAHKYHPYKNVHADPASFSLSFLLNRMAQRKETETELKVRGLAASLGAFPNS